MCGQYLIGRKCAVAGYEELFRFAGFCQDFMMLREGVTLYPAALVEAADGTVHIHPAAQLKFLEKGVMSVANRDSVLLHRKCAIRSKPGRKYAFLQFGSECVELSRGVGQFSVAIVEDLETGDVDIFPAREVVFISPIEVDKSSTAILAA